LCQHHGLSVQHRSPEPDQFRCGSCHLAFELAETGSSLHVTHWPAALDELDGLAEDWLSADELQSLAHKIAVRIPKAATGDPHMPAIHPSPAMAAIEPPSKPIKQDEIPHASQSVSDELVIRIRGLRATGRNQHQIRRILLQEGKSPDELNAAFRIVDGQEKQEHKRQKSKLLWSLVMTALFLLVCFISTGILVQLPAEDKPQIVAAAQATLAPSIAESLHLNTPVVSYSNNPPPAAYSISGCPRYADQAALLFGGDAANWSSPPGSNGWFMIDPTGSNRVYVPAEMTAAYMQVGDQIVLVEVRGPANMDNVSYVAISCP
jgi:hypothetical protein